MDMITNALLAEFSKEQEITQLPEDERFEHLAAFLAVKRQHGETFSTSDLVTGKGGDTGIDAFAAIVNGTLVTDVDELNDVSAASGHLDVTFLFVQAERSPTFDGTKILSFGFGVRDFFAEQPSLKRNAHIEEAAALMRLIYSNGTKFKRGLPACKLYYFTTGKWNDDNDLVARKNTVVSDLAGINLFRSVDFVPVGAEGIRTLYQQAKNAISRQFEFVHKAVVPAIVGVKEAYLGLLPAEELLSILRDEDGDITKSIFYDNVRDWQAFNAVNTEIRKTLESADSARFALMNNGITIIARDLQPVGNKFTIEDFQIVNGCQTSHVLFEVSKEGQLSSSIMVPLRLIVTTDEDVINSIIRATNRQTEVKEEQFFALTEFPKQLEAFFASFPEPRRLHFERRSRQYDSVAVERTRVVTQANLTRAFAAMFLGDPHTVTRRPKTIRDKMGTEIFGHNHEAMAYYVSAFALYKLDYLFRSHKIDTKFKPARYHIIYALRLLAASSQLPAINSRAMKDYCLQIASILWDPTKSEEMFERVLAAIESAAKDQEFTRDSITTGAFTEKVARECGVKKPSGGKGAAEGKD